MNHFESAKAGMGINMKKIIPASYYIFLGAGLILVLLGLFYAKSEVFDVSGQSASAVAEPIEVRQVSVDVREFDFDWRVKDDVKSCIAFFSNHQYVSVYADGVLIYALENGGSVFGKTTGSCWNFVEIPERTTKLLVRLEAVYPEVRDYNMAFEQGNAIQMYSGLMRSFGLEIVVSILSMAIGMLLILYWFVVNRRTAVGKEICYFGIFSLLIGCWSFNESEMATMLLHNRVAWSFTAYIILLLVVVPFVLFVKYFLEVENECFTYFICVAGYLNMVICIVLHLTGILEFKQSVIGTHILMGLALLYLLMALIMRKKKYGFDRKVRANIAGAVVLIFSYGIDMIAFYSSYRMTYVIGRVGLLVYICLLGKEAAAESLSKIDKGRKAEIYRELALKDTLTRMYNRNAYYDWLNQHHRYKGMAIVTFDLNNLKECNDTKGHSMGDRYIRDAAGLITEVFESHGSCFRIGGDEFCVTINNIYHTDIYACIRLLCELEEAYNQKSQDIDMKIACGFAVFDKKTDRSLEDTRDRADADMYQNKKYIKMSGKLFHHQRGK